MTNFSPPHSMVNISPRAGVLLALSGGADSCALLHLLAADAAKSGYPLHTVHVHHGIRGTEADRDEQFCRALSAHYGLPIHVLRADIPALAKESGESYEMAGRRVRYDYFARVMREFNLELLATAHHADDNLETVLLRLIGGSATAGLGGIAPARSFATGYLVRPLLHATRADIERYCEQNGLTFVNDSTNDDTAYLRNRLRAEIVPLLKEVAPHLPQHLLSTCDTLREDDDCLRALAAKLYEKVSAPDGALGLSDLQAAPAALQKRVLLTAIRRISPDVRIQRCHMEALCHLIESRHGEACLPDNMRAMADGQTLRFLSHPSDSPPLPTAFYAPLQLGRQHFDALGVCVTLCQTTDAPTDKTSTISENAKNPQNVYNTFIYDTLTFDTISDDAHFRLRRDGDTLLLGGMHRRVRKLQNAAHMPPSLRERLPLLCDAHGVLWVPFIGVRDGFITTPCGKKQLRLNVCGTSQPSDTSPAKNENSSKNIEVSL